MKQFLLALCLFSIPLLAEEGWLRVSAAGVVSSAQTQFTAGTDRGIIGVKLAIPEFQAAAGDTKAAALTEVFNKVLWDDLDYSGGVTLVSRSLYPLGKFTSPGEINPSDWTTPAVDAQFIAFGNSRMTGDRIRVEARLWDLKAPQNREAIGKAYTSEPTDAGARLIAHQFADAIIELIGGGNHGVALTKIAYIGERTIGVKELYGLVSRWRKDRIHEFSPRERGYRNLVSLGSETVYIRSARWDDHNARLVARWKQDRLGDQPRRQQHGNLCRRLEWQEFAAPDRQQSGECLAGMEPANGS